MGGIFAICQKVVTILYVYERQCFKDKMDTDQNGQAKKDKIPN